MAQTGGKRHANKSLKAWVSFVKKVQDEEGLSYKDAIHRAKERKDKGESWMAGGADTEEEVSVEMTPEGETMEMTEEVIKTPTMEGGKKRRTRRRGNKAIKRTRSRSAKKARSHRRR